MNKMLSPSKRSSTFARGPVVETKEEESGGHHSISQEEVSYFVRYINKALLKDTYVATRNDFPIDESNNDLFETLKDGIVLCKFLNAVTAEDVLDERVLNIPKKGKTLNQWQQNENIDLGINSAKALGCSVVNIGAADIREGTKHLVLGVVWQIVCVGLFSAINIKSFPELCVLLEDDEEIDDLMALPTDQLLKRWMNYHLKRANYPSVSNFGKDIKSCEAYIHLLNQIEPKKNSLDALSIGDPQDRANAVIQAARNIGYEPVIAQNDILNGQERMNMAFVANIFHTNHGLKMDVQQQMETAKLLDEGDEEQTREERTYRMWLNSLGISTSCSNLFENCKDGYMILEALDKLSPGVVSWRRVNKPPIKMKFKAMENCSNAVDLVQKEPFNINLVGIGGGDLHDGNKMLILGFTHQLMRWAYLSMLGSLGGKGSNISDKDILSWANRTVKASGKSSSITSFRDKSISSGIFFLDLLSAVESRAIDGDMVTAGENEKDKEMNAKYILSVARKIGCTPMLTWEDITDVRGKMIMTLAASIMVKAK